MDLSLENGYTVKLPGENKYNIYYGPNKIGKTQISFALKKHYEKSNEKILLFNDNILSDMVIQTNDDINSFEIMPMAQEYNKYRNEVEKYKEKISIKNNLKKLCLTNAKKAFQGFNMISEYFDEDAFTYIGPSSEPVYTEKEIKTMYKPGTNNLNIFEIISELSKENIKIISDNIKSIVDYNVYDVQKRIIEDSKKYKSCPVCFSVINEENLNKIRQSVETGSMTDQLKLSILFYLDNESDTLKKKMSDILTCESYDEFNKGFILEVEKSIISYLSKQYEKDDIRAYNDNKEQMDEILKKIKEFKITKDDKLGMYIKEKLKKHSVYKNTDIDIKVEDGKLKVTNSKISYDKMSKSEQNYFKFLYFDILVYQKVNEGKLHIIIDDPFDSYDDIYVQDSISIITKLIYEYSSYIDTVDIFSHSMYIFDLYNSLKSIPNKFKIYWMDQIGPAPQIKIFKDGYDLLRKIDVNPYDYGMILKISDKMVDKYSLAAFAALLRNEINIEKLLLNNNNSEELNDVKNKINKLYDVITESVNHVKQEITIIDLNDIINKIFYFDLNDDILPENETVESLFNEISSDYRDINIKVKTGTGKINSISKEDICYILIYKILFGLKIRRLLEKKASDIVNEPYGEVGDLIKKIPESPLYDFYCSHKYIINSFDHSSSRIVPPIFVYSFRSLQTIYDELVAI